MLHRYFVADGEIHKRTYAEKAHLTDKWRKKLAPFSGTPKNARQGEW